MLTKDFYFVTNSLLGFLFTDHELQQFFFLRIGTLFASNYMLMNLDTFSWPLLQLTISFSDKTHHSHNSKTRSTTP